MFRALAEYVLRGRIQATVVALLGNFFPFIGPSAVALVTLTKGIAQGFWVFMWVSLPLMLLHYMSADNPLLIVVSVASLGLMVVAGTVHQALASWQWTILATIVASMAVALGFGLLMATSVNNLMEQIMAVFAEISEMQDNTLQQLTVTKPSLLGGVAMVLSLGCVISMLIARWWQSLIYNPGGFQEEFHSFKIESKTTVVLISAVLLGVVMPKDYQFWTMLAAIPLLLSGIALIHFTIKQFQLGGHWLVILYLAPFLFGALIAMFLVSLAVGDSFLDIRSRLLEYKNRKH